jgi:hypothetical protein
MASYATRGNLAAALYQAMGLTSPSSTGKFGDAGELDGVVSTLSDLGITNGVGNGQYGTAQQTTRGQAFTMIARALGLADANTTIEDATQALVAQGIVQGYGGDPSNLGINDPLQVGHLDLLMDRLAPELAKASPSDPSTTIGDAIKDRVSDEADNSRAEESPDYAAYLAALGVSRGEIEDEIALREELFLEDNRRMSESYARATEQAVGGIQTDFENRGLFRSGTRMRSEAEKRQAIGYQQEQEAYAAQREHESGLRALERSRSDLDRQAAEYRTQYEGSQAADRTEEAYG